VRCAGVLMAADGGVLDGVWHKDEGCRTKRHCWWGAQAAVTLGWSCVMQMMAGGQVMQAQHWSAGGLYMGGKFPPESREHGNCSHAWVITIRAEVGADVVHMAKWYNLMILNVHTAAILPLVHLQPGGTHADRWISISGTKWLPW
jgi:hypothetical protein